MKKFLEGEGAKLFEPFGRCCPENVKCELCDKGYHHGYSGTLTLLSNEEKESVTVCEYCQEPIEYEDEHKIGPVDDSLTICDACYEHLH